MIRKIFKYNSIQTQSEEFKNWLTNPHKSYYSEVNELLSNDVDIQGLCHVTGGGLIENPPRVINDDLRITFELEISKEFKIKY
jgi:phosphoribosylaminoimidazole (AIR) synthetase